MDVRKEWDGGIGRYIRNLLNGLQKSDVIKELHLWAKPGSDIFGIESGCLRPHVERARLYGVWEQVSLSRKVNRVSPDLFHAPHYIVPVSTKVPLVVTIHDIIHLVFPKTPLHKLYAALQMGIAIRRAQAIITPSSFSRDELIRYFPEAAGKMFPIPHGLEPSFFERPPAGDEEIGHALHLPDRYLLYVGNHKPHKNLNQLLEIYQELFRNDPQLFLCVTGNKEDEKGVLLAAATRLGLKERVRFLGILENDALRACYRNALCFVFPSLYEGFGFPPLEAMACGTPVVAYRVASLPEVVGDGGILVDPGDGKAFCQAALSFLGDEKRREEWGRKGRSRAMKFKWEDAVERHIAIYRQVRSKQPV